MALLSIGMPAKEGHKSANKDQSSSQIGELHPRDKAFDLATHTRGQPNAGQGYDCTVPRASNSGGRGSIDLNSSETLGAALSCSPICRVCSGGQGDTATPCMEPMQKGGSLQRLKGTV